MGPNDRPKRQNAGSKLKSMIYNEENDGIEEVNNENIESAVVPPAEDLINNISDESDAETTVNGDLCKTINKDFISADFFNSFYEEYLEFKHTIIEKLANHEEGKNKNLDLNNRIRLLESEIIHLKDLNKELKEDSKNHLKIIKTLSEGQLIDPPWQTVCSKKLNQSKSKKPPPAK